MGKWKERLDNFVRAIAKYGCDIILVKLSHTVVKYSTKCGGRDLLNAGIEAGNEFALVASVFGTKIWCNKKMPDLLVRAHIFIPCFLATMAVGYFHRKMRQSSTSLLLSPPLVVSTFLSRRSVRGTARAFDLKDGNHGALRCMFRELDHLWDILEELYISIRPSQDIQVEPFDCDAIKAIFSMLSEVKNLKRLKVSGNSDLANIPLQSLASFLNSSTSLQELELTVLSTEEVRLGSEVQAEFFAALSGHASLKKLTLNQFQFIVTNYGCDFPWFETALRYNNVLSELTVRSAWRLSYDTDRLLNMLRINSTIEKITLNLWPSPAPSHLYEVGSDWYVIPLARGLRTSPNSNLKKLFIESEDLDDGCIRFLVSLVTNNCKLETLEFSFDKQLVRHLSMRARIDAFLRLNREGREAPDARDISLFTDKEWMQILFPGEDTIETVGLQDGVDIRRRRSI